MCKTIRPLWLVGGRHPAERVTRACRWAWLFFALPINRKLGCAPPLSSTPAPGLNPAVPSCPILSAPHQSRRKPK